MGRIANFIPAHRTHFNSHLLFVALLIYAEMVSNEVQILFLPKYLFCIENSFTLPQEHRNHQDWSQSKWIAWSHMKSPSSGFTHRHGRVMQWCKKRRWGAELERKREPVAARQGEQSRSDVAETELHSLTFFIRGLILKKIRCLKLLALGIILGYCSLFSVYLFYLKLEWSNFKLSLQRLEVSKCTETAVKMSVLFLFELLLLPSTICIYVCHLWVYVLVFSHAYFCLMHIHKILCL